MFERVFFLLFIVCFSFLAFAEEQRNKIYYELPDEPIDVVIVAHPKDKEVLDYCIDGIRRNCHKIRRIITVSSEKLTNKAEWFNEKKFPFTIDDVALAIGKENKKRSEAFFRRHNRGPGWYLQQLLKLYSAFVIPGISSNVLIVDADVVFLNPVEFLNEKNGGLFCLSQLSAKKLYIQHAKRLVPGYKRINPESYSVCHHMLFQRPILKDLFNTVEQYHHQPFWKAFCYCVQYNKKKGASEYEIYYNYALTHTDQVAIRELKWINSGCLDLRNKFKEEGYHFAAFQSYLIKKNIKIGKIGHD